MLDTVKGHLPEFSAAFSCVNQLQAKVLSVDEHLRDLSVLAGQSSLAEASREGKEHVDRLQARLSGFERTLTALRSLAQVTPLTSASLVCDSASASSADARGGAVDRCTAADIALCVVVRATAA